LKRKRTSSSKAPSAPRKRGPGRRAGPPKWLPELPPPPAKRATKSAPRPPRVADPHAEREASRYERPIPSREAILAFLGDHGQLMKAEAIADALGLRSPPDFDALTKRLAAMLRDGQLIQNRRGGYGVASKLDLIRGGVIANAEGYGFLRPDEGGDDLYLSPAEMRKVLHGDRVLASVVGVDRRGRRQGAIVEVLERRAARLVGRLVEENGLMLVSPDDRRVHQDILIPPAERAGARAGQIVIAEITEPPTAYRGPIGRIVAVLGERLEPSLIVEMAIASHDLPHEWPQPALDEAARVEPTVTAEEIAGRVDLRDWPLVTIDGADAKDFDDAVYARPTRTGYRLIVAIADVSHYVRPGTALDEEAYKRATSVYFPGFVVPMLPESLSNGICSLNPHVDRLCMVCDMRIDQEGEVSGTRFYPAVMRSHARLTYDQVWKAIGERDAETRADLGPLMTHLDHLHRLYGILAEARRRRGAIDFGSREVEFRLDAQGEVVQLDARERNDAHMLIEECMIAANVQAARFLLKKRVPAPYRVHEPPPESKYGDLLEFLREFRLRLPAYGEVEPADFSKLLLAIRKRPDAGLIESVVLRSQSMAVYQPQNTGHFGLALDAYAHFTSPIRRYPDLLVHRAIRHALGGGKPGDYRYSAGDMAVMATHCSHNERRASEAERDVDERYRCAWMEKHVGSEFDGVVSGVTSFGLFVELVDSKINGLVHITQLPNDYYHFDPIRHLLTGERRGLNFRLGDALRVQVLRASLEDRKIDFRLVADETAGSKRR
jgi:ribonuclease R